MMTYRVLTDEDVSRMLTLEQAITVMERCMRAKAAGKLMALPRFTVGLDDGGLVFTAGAETQEANAIGFRVYDTFEGPKKNKTQLVAVYDARDGALRGLVLGDLIGVMRTAAINAVAIRYMARPDAQTLGVIGTGTQARMHARAALAAGHFTRAMVYSPNAEHRGDFAAEVSGYTGVPVETAASSQPVVSEADVLICATTSSTPVFDAGWLRPGMHVNTVGPKFKDAHELPIEAAHRSRVIATDSLAQVDAYPSPYFLLGTPERERMLALEEIVTGKQAGRRSPEDITLFCSVGLAGTEVVLADELLRLDGNSEKHDN
jgi:alanine dehydrogenase